MVPNSILLTQMDFNRLNSLIQSKHFFPESESELEELELEIERAKLIDFPEVPPNLVTMNSRFHYLNVTDNKLGEMTIVYPSQAHSEKNSISVLAPLGTAFLGLREGEEIDWSFPNGQTKRLRVLEIIYQPEANGDWHL